MLKCKSLFDSEEFESAEDCLEYCQKVHNFNIKVLKKRHSMDCFSYIRLINFIRSTGPSAKVDKTNVRKAIHRVTLF